MASYLRVVCETKVAWMIALIHAERRSVGRRANACASHLSCAGRMDQEGFFSRLLEAVSGSSLLDVMQPLFVQFPRRLFPRHTLQFVPMCMQKLNDSLRIILP